MPSIIDLFPDRVMPEPNSGCWLWTGAWKSREEPYGRLRREGKFVTAHREAYRLANGEIPEGMLVLHKCDVMPCCNPDHLYLGDDAQNCRDRDTRGRHNTPAGSKHGNAKLTEDAVRAIRAITPGKKLPNGMAKTLADKYGVSLLLISEIRGGKGWRHVA